MQEKTLAKVSLREEHMEKCVTLHGLVIIVVFKEIIAWGFVQCHRLRWSRECNLMVSGMSGQVSKVIHVRGRCRIMVCELLYCHSMLEVLTRAAQNEWFLSFRHGPTSVPYWHSMRENPMLTCILACLLLTQCATEVFDSFC